MRCTAYGAQDAAHATSHSPSLEVLHLIVEYARHNGHADLIRESIDGSRGE